MRTLIIILILLSFLQATILPMELVLTVILLKSWVKADTKNLYLAFGLGLLISLLQFTPLGINSLIYLSLVQAIMMFSKSPLSNNFLVVLPVTVVCLILNHLGIALFVHQSVLIWPQILFESLLILPIYLIIRFWEERFILRPEIRLKV